MQRTFLQMILLGGVLAGVSCPVACQAVPSVAAPVATPVATPVTAQVAAPIVAAVKQAVSPVAGFGQPAQESTLARSRGGADTGNIDTVTTTATLGGTVANNTAIHVVTGSNYIDNGSFANMSGLPMVIQNSGANVLIQNATVINLQMK
jgi:hypothetical protein